MNGPAFGIVSFLGPERSHFLPILQVMTTIITSICPVFYHLKSTSICYTIYSSRQVPELASIHAPILMEEETETPDLFTCLRHDSQTSWTWIQWVQIQCSLSSSFLSLSFLKKHIYLFFRERGREGERQGGKHWCKGETSMGCLS